MLQHLQGFMGNGSQKILYKLKYDFIVYINSCNESHIYLKMENNLRKNRESIFQRLFEIDSPASLFDYQLELALEIMHCESLQKKKKNDLLKKHIHLIRCYGDSLTWQLLYSHTIRQLSKNQKNKSFLIDQGKGFQKTLDDARELVKYDLPVVIADLTNCIRIGDIIVCTNPETPDILECKSEESHFKFGLQGRKGRQLSRMKSIAEYLNKGVAKIFGEDKARLCIETKIEPQYNWSIVNEVLKDLERNGFSYRLISPYEIIGAFHYGTDYPDDELKEKLKDKFKLKHAFVGVHYVPIEEAWPTIPPPTVWRVDTKYKFDLMEGEIIVFHIFDPQALLGFGNSLGKITAVSPNKDYELEVTVKDKKLQFSSKFTDDVIYGFQTVDFVGTQIIASALKTIDKTKEYIKN